jgi:glycosyltransferase involved in cell wall biosynthesis
MAAEALGALGTVDVCLLDRWRSPELELDWPSWVGDAEWCRVETSPASLLTKLGRSSPVSERVAPDALQAGRTRFFSHQYDLTWCVEPRGYEPVAELVSRPVVLDLHNVLSASVMHKRRLLVRRPWLSAAWREAINDPVFRIGIERRWRAWESRAVRTCDRVVVCSEVDRRRLHGAPSVIPNCYRQPARPAGRDRDPGAPLRIGFVGLLDYQPNFDAVRWFADAILPRVRRFERDVEFHVIGKAGPGLRDIGQRRGVRLLGFVPDPASELRKLSVLVAPIRFGGGTRFKILEAFAHEIPIVSTTIGAEGIEAEEGEHLLLRDDPAAFARAIVDIHRNPALRDRLVAAAARLYKSRYTWERGVASVKGVVEELTTPTAVVPGRTASVEKP